MVPAMHGAEVFAVHMSVDLGRRDVRVAQEFLDGRQVRPPLEQVGGERMPERVG